MKYKVEDSKRGAYRGRGSSLEWRRVRKSRKYRIRKWREDCWARIFALFRENNLQRLQIMHEECRLRKRGSIQERKKPCKNSMSGWRK